MNDGKIAYQTLKEYRRFLARQQVRTLAGQIRHGKPNEAMNGLAKILDAGPRNINRPERSGECAEAEHQHAVSTSF